ncbi:ABC transporter substrate-binding protein [Maridesulfovibrio bastinii]|uniref:ABC transporter substrate-binding protein n=1 Tax=Maridesulfovibrio bastinii TaxID=47157 RepID=UPI0004119003|nr:ABC transporter substrate-binding protein [Maridesulfovibrio bastinii]
MRVFILTVFMAASFMVSSVSPAWSGDSAFRIGVLYNLTGADAARDTPGFHGMELACDKINEEGGISGHKLILVAADCQSDQTKTALAAETLAGRGNIKVLAGLNDASDAMIAVPAATSAEKMFVISGSTMQTLPYMFGKFCYMTSFGDSMQSRAATKFAVRELKAGKAWIATDIVNKGTKIIGKYYKKSCRKYGIKVVDNVWYSAGNGSFPVPSNNKNEDGLSAGDADVLFLATDIADAVTAVRGLRKAGFNQPILAGDNFDSPVLEQLADNNSGKIYITTPVSYDNPDQVVQDFVKSYRSRFGTDPENAYAALGYDTVMMIAEAMKKAGSHDAEMIRQAYSELQGYKGVTGEISYPEGLRVPLKNLDIVKFENGIFSFIDRISPN